MITKKYIGAGAYEVNGIDENSITIIQNLIPDDSMTFSLENNRLITACVSHLPSLLGLFIINSDFAQTNIAYQKTESIWNWHNDSVADPDIDCKVILYFVSEDLTVETGDRVSFRKTTEKNEYTYNIKNRSLVVQSSDKEGLYQHKREANRRPIQSRIILSMNCKGYDVFLKTVPDVGAF